MIRTGGTPRILFIGVSTGASRIMALFPRWAPLIGTDASLIGVDLPLDADRDRYRRLMESIAADDDLLGAVITSHKLGLLAACRDLFDDLDPLARLTHEVSAVSKRVGLIGHARDPLATVKALDGMLGKASWPRPDQHVLCFGAGGAATALAVALFTEPDDAGALIPRSTLPARTHYVDIRRERLEALRRVIHELAVPDRCELHLHCAETANDELLRELPDNSLIINATGMGKDLPGAPVTRHARFPAGATVWDLNYRGELGFLALARGQARSSGLSVHDGWRYFLHGWMEALAPVLGYELNEVLVKRLEEAAHDIG